MIDEIEEMIVQILRPYQGHWPFDITDRVFLEIEHNPEYRKQYEGFADGDYGTTNAQIGAFVCAYTGLAPAGTNHHPNSSLITSYTFLIPQRQPNQPKNEPPESAFA